ncbi:MAG: hypothetical protein ACAH59_10910 [Pseudobdellovibrionaceae bacterium]
MRKLRVVLALLWALGCSASAFAQWDDGNGDAQGGICRPGEDCQFPDNPPYPGDHEENDHGGGDPVDPSPYDPPGGGHGNGNGHGNHGPSQDREEVRLNQTIQNQSLDLMRLLRLQNHRGQRVESVEVIARSNDGYTAVVLTADGYEEDSSYASGSWLTLHPRRQLTIGQNVRDLRLQIRGRLYIESIVVNLSGGYNQPNPPYPPPGGGGQQVVLPGYINQTFYQHAIINLENLTGLHQYRGYRVESVVVYARGGRARLMVNGSVEGQLSFGPSTSGQRVHVQRHVVVGQNLHDLSLDVAERLTVERVEVILRR